ncbi:MAG: hypothetical protein J1E31_06190 [Helicobacter sp.]|nr:hypothetical protein [Helicobacter sp.]
MGEKIAAKILNFLQWHFFLPLQGDDCIIIKVILLKRLLRILVNSYNDKRDKKE